MNTRREFFRKASIFGAAIAAPVATTVVVTMPEAKKENEDVSHLKPEGNSNLVLNGGLSQRPIAPELGADGFALTGFEFTHNNKVEMSVGKDDRLWIKIGDEWKRVAVES
jgi:hypothetical protein